MATHSWQVAVGDQVFLGQGDEEVGAVMKVARDHLVVYIENAGEFRLEGPEITSAHDGKLVLDPQKLSEDMLRAIEQAHAREKE
jgi:hypothetical protein